jgi:uncharacterized protein with von Willebrand factor type A (vWA) domain
MEQVLHDFISSLRSFGVRISTSERIDAFRAAELVGYQDREILKSSLSAALAKTAVEEERFNECFALFFSFNSFPDHATEHTLRADSQHSVSPLTRMLISQGHAELMASLMEAVQEAQTNEIKFFTQKGLYIHRILSHMGIDGLDSDIRLLRQENTSASIQHAAQLQEARDRLFEDVRGLVEREHALYARAPTEDIMERYLKNAKLGELEKSDYDRMYIIVRKMAKRLSDVYSRRMTSFRRGHLDARKTLRESMACEGVPFDIKWKRKKIDRPDVIVICDVSRSVAAAVRFFLLLAYGLNKAVIKIRSFIFCSNIVEASSVFDDYPVEEAVARLQKGTGLDIVLGPTDYGRAFLDFRKNWLDGITRKASVIIIGDARNNYGDPQTGSLSLIRKRSKRVIWLNPESRSFWGTGDSEMKKYLPYCNIARECNTLSQLERAIDSLL